MTGNELKTAALSVILYNHIANGGKLVSMGGPSVELNIEHTNHLYLSTVLEMLSDIDMSKVSLSISDCPCLEGRPA